MHDRENIKYVSCDYTFLTPTLTLTGYEHVDVGVEFGV